jgi:hypothetical protein
LLQIQTEILDTWEKASRMPKAKLLILNAKRVSSHSALGRLPQRWRSRLREMAQLWKECPY